MEKFFLFDKQTRKEAQIDPTRRFDALQECYEMALGWALQRFFELKQGTRLFFSIL